MVRGATRSSNAGPTSHKCHTIIPVVGGLPAVRELDQVGTGQHELVRDGAAWSKGGVTHAEVHELLDKHAPAHSLCISQSVIQATTPLHPSTPHTGAAIGQLDGVRQVCGARGIGAILVGTDELGVDVHGGHVVDNASDLEPAVLQHMPQQRRLA